MSSAMRITAILLKNYRQFRSFKLDLTDPVTKQPLDKICFIGSNGTGKSTLLMLLSRFLQSVSPAFGGDSRGMGLGPNCLIAFKVKFETDEYFVIGRDRTKSELEGEIESGIYILPDQVESAAEWAKLWDPDIEFRGNPIQTPNNNSLHFSAGDIGLQFLNGIQVF